MNKDVLYIEPEDDITDIITKIENSKEKIVALVPPKKASVFRSIVNIKLITKAGANAEKNIVLVTTDPSIIKLAAATKLPVTKNLQSAPAIPQAETAEVDTTVKEKIVEDGGDKITAEEDTVETAEPLLEGKSGFLDDELRDETEESSEKDTEEATRQSDKAKPAKTSALSRKLGDNKIALWMKEHKKILVPCGVGAILLILVMIWMFAIVPAVTVTVGIRTTSANFSENVTFTNDITAEDASAGKFYLEEKKTEEKLEVEFEATGKKNVGAKATGNLVIYAYFKENGQVTVNAGTIFTYDNKLSYVAQEAVTLAYDSDKTTRCDNDGDTRSLLLSGCLVSAQIAVTAENPGSEYDVAPNTTAWKTVANVGVYSDKPISGGTDEVVTVVQQSDIDAAKAKIETTNENINKEKLLSTISDTAFVIDASFKQTVDDGVSVPALGEEVKEGEKAKLTVTVTDTIAIIDATKVEEFIREKAKLAENYKIYEMNDPFVENFTKTDDGYVAKLKTSYVAGPKITESEVAEIVKGKGIGTARQDLEKSFDGISKISIEGNFPWVMSVPNNTDKITVNIEVNEK